ncbi:MAG: lysophospholipid acyltransferase family protein [Thermoguttaceae bacterium]|nr:lysophospholipid acyltransferase family protein [Thermoguttaceae bacterium]
MKIMNKGLIRAAGSVVSFGVHLVDSTLDYRVAYYDPVIDPAYANDGKRRIYIFWHEYIQFFVYLRKHCHLAMLLSKHADADVLEELARLLGFGGVRGSTNRGGVQALREMMHKEQNENYDLTITPDGPRGPRRELAPGCVYLASKLQIPIVAMGVGYDRPFRFNSWDRFALPRPFSRARCIPSGDIHVPPDLDKQGIDYFRKKIERLLNHLTDEAESWARSGDSYENESSVLPGPNFSCLYYARPKRSIGIDEGTSSLETVKAALLTTSN